MKWIFSMAGLLVFMTAAAQTKKSEWTLANSRNDVNISYRWVFLETDQKIREMKTEFFIKSDVNSILKQFTNSTYLKKWQNAADECKITKSSDEKWKTYMSFSLPWPLKNKDLVMENQLVKSEKYWMIKMNSTPKSEPVYKGKSRINSLESEWKFIPQKNGTTKVIYTTLTYDQPEFPRSITDPIIQKKLFQSIELLKKYASL